MFTQHPLNPRPGSRRINRESILRQISHQPLKAAREREYLWHVSNGAHHPHVDVQSYSPAFASRGRKIRCDGAKPKCYHCSRRQVNQECTYDSIPKRRGPDRTQRARVSGTRQEIDRGPYSRRRRCLPTTVDKAGSSNGTQQPRVVAKPSLPDTLQPQQCDAYIDTLDPGFELLENVAGFSISDARDHSQMLTVDSASTGYAVSRPFLQPGYIVNCILVFRPRRT